MLGDAGWHVNPEQVARIWRLVVTDVAPGSRVRPVPNGHLAMHFDPQIGRSSRNLRPTHHFTPWTFWDRIIRPVLILAGAGSDFPTPPFLGRMRRVRPTADELVIEGAGQTPTVRSAEQPAPVLERLRS